LAALAAKRALKHRFKLGEKMKFFVSAIAGMSRFVRASSFLFFALLSSALIANPATAQLAPPKLLTVSPTGVDLATGSYVRSVNDLSIGPLTLERSYLTADSVGNGMSSSYFGSGWTHNFDIFARQDNIAGQNSSVVIIGRNTYKFTGHPPSTFPENDEDGTSLTSVGSAMIFTDRDGTVYKFLPGTIAKVSTITSPDGSVLAFNYISNLLKTVTSSHGYAIVFDYSGSTVTTACGYNLAVAYVTTSTNCVGAALKVSYGYGASRLTSVTDILGNVAYNTYDSLGLLSCITDPGTTVCKYTTTNTANVHTGKPNVTRQVAADGAVWTFDCSCGAAALGAPDDPFIQEYSNTTEPSGAMSSMAFMQGSPSSYLNENNQSYTPTYVGRVLLSTILPEGNQIIYRYNGRLVESGRSFIPKQGSGLATINQSTRAFPSSCANPITCNLPTTVTDANGNVSSFTYDPTHGGVLTETSPANSAGISAVVRHAYAQFFAYVRNSGGGYSPAATPVWLRTEDRTCRTTATVGAACAGGGADEVITTYDYGPAAGPNNLLLRGVAVTADGVTRRTCYGYDWQGNKISETKPRAGLAVCS
jgi:YD repeat-containing protein